MTRSVLLIFFSLLYLGLAVPLFAQETDPQAVVNNSLGQDETATTGMLVLQFGATGMTDSAAKAYSNLVAQNLVNSNRFVVTNASQAEEVIMREQPRLLPCFDIGCGIQIAKIIGAQRVLSGHISLTASGHIILQVKLVNVNDNALEFEDSIRFTDETMDRRFYILSQQIANNTPLRGRVLEANNRMAVISLGGNNGVQVGDRLILYKDIHTRSSGQSLPVAGASRRSNIGILTITKVGDHSSEGVYFQTVETPKPGQFVSTFLEKRKQIAVVNDVRKELDTHLRNVFEIEQKVVIKPISIEDVDKKRWIYSIRAMENERDWWQNWLLGSGIGSAFFLSQYKPGDDLKALGAVGIFAYSAIRYFQAKGRLKSLVDEGKFKGYLDVNFRPNASIQLSWTMRF